jgi:hypothetical protein
MRKEQEIFENAKKLDELSAKFGRKPVVEAKKS